MCSVIFLKDAAYPRKSMYIRMCYMDVVILLELEAQAVVRACILYYVHVKLYTHNRCSQA